MSMLAVLDLKGGLIVRGIAGERASYQPVRSTLADDSAPVTIARGLARSFGFHDAYLADLDAIAGDSPSWSIYESVAQCGFNLIVDAGITDHRRAELFAEYAKHHVWLRGAVVGLESIASPAVIKEAIGL